jgi:DNA-binding beta-propeller fold protein YncE
MRRILNLAVGLGLLSVACSGDASRHITDVGPPPPPPFIPGPEFSTHPGGTAVDSIALSGQPSGLDISSKDVAYVTQVSGNSVARFDLPSELVTTTFSVGSDPTGVAFHPAGKAAWVTNQTHLQTNGTIGVIDALLNKQVRTRTPGGNTFQVIVTPDGGSIYVSSNTTNANVYAINAVTDSTIATLPLGGTLTNGFAFHPDGVRLYASQISGGTIKVIDTRTNTFQTFSTPPGAGKLQGIVVSKDGNELYVADETAKVLRFISVSTGSQLAVDSLGGGGFGVGLTPDNVQVWVSLALGGTGCTSGGCVKVIDRVSRTIVNTIQTHGSPRRIAFNAAGTIGVITNESGYVDFVK